MRILLTNDDGVDSPGLLALARALAPLAEVAVVAPDRERSGSSHAFTYQRPIPFRALTLPGGLSAHAVDGTPVDCVKVGLFLCDNQVDWVIAGINLGANVGVDAFYSGTVGAACEGAMQGCRAVAFSLALREGQAADLEPAARLCRGVFDQILEQAPPPGACLNVNVPALPPDQIRGIWPSAQAFQRYLPRFERGPSQNGWQVLLKESQKILADPHDDADYTRLEQGWITITPLSLDRTERQLLEVMRAWTWRL